MSLPEHVPPPSLPTRQLSEIALGRVRKLRLRRRIQMSAAIGLTIVLVLVGVPVVLRATIDRNIQNIAPVEQPDDRSAETDASQAELRPGSGSGSGARSGAGTDAESGVGSNKIGAGSRFGNIDEGITFASRRDDTRTSAIYTMRPNATDVRRVTNGSGNHVDPVRSPNGAQIAFVTRDGDRDILIVDAADLSVRNVTQTRGHGETDPAWSPDGDRLVYSRYTINSSESRDLYVADLSDGTTTQLTDTSDVEEQSPAWSPDGRSIVFHRTDWNADPYAPGLFAMDADGSGLRRLTTGHDWEPAWSPDGQSIVFARDDNLGGPAPGGVNTTPANSSSIYVIEAAGTGLRRLTTDSTVLDYAPDWSPDGKRLIFTRDPDGAEDPTLRFAGAPEGGPLSSIYIVDADGSDVAPLTDPSSGDFYADWHGGEM